MAQQDTGETSWFHPHGQILGWFGVVVCFGLAVSMLVWGGPSIGFALGLSLLGALVWCFVIRPRVGLDDRTLRLRGPFGEVGVPLAAIESVVLAQVLVVRTARDRFTCAGLGRTRAQALQRNNGIASPTHVGADFAEERIVAKAEDARAQTGVRMLSAEQEQLAAEVVRRRAWPEIAVCAVLAVAWVVALAL